MKILVISTCPMGLNGVTNVIINLFKKIDVLNIKIDFVAANSCTDDIKNLLERMGSKVYVLNNRLKKPHLYVKNLIGISQEYDIVHVHGNSATMALEMVAAKAAGVKFRICHSHSTTCVYKKIDKILRPIFYAFCNGRIACGVEAGKWLFKNKKFLILKNGIDTDIYSFSLSEKNTIRKELGLEKNIVLGHVGGFIELKNHDFIIDVFSELYKKNKKYRLLLVGDGEVKPRIQKKVDSMGLSSVVIFYGCASNVNKLLNCIDIILMPSINEGFPLSLVEEQANGLHCIISDRITREVNLSGNVDFLPIDNPDDVNIWVNVILNTKVTCDRSELSVENIKKIEKSGYDIKSAAKNLMDYYKKGYAFYEKNNDNN